MIALGQVAVPLRESVLDAGVFHTFGEHDHPESVSELDRALHDGSGTRVGDQMGDKRAVELELVHGQLMQIGKRAVSGAVVVDRDAHPQGAQAGQYVLGMFGVDHQDILGDLQDEGIGGTSCRSRRAWTWEGNASSCRSEADRLTATCMSWPSPRQEETALRDWLRT